MRLATITKDLEAIKTKVGASLAGHRADLRRTPMVLTDRTGSPISWAEEQTAVIKDFHNNPWDKVPDRRTCGDPFHRIRLKNEAGCSWPGKHSTR